MSEVERLKKIVQDQTRMLQEKNRLLSELEYRLKKSIVTGSRKEDLAKFQFQLSKDTIEGQASLLKTILGSIPFGLMVVDTKKQVVACNQAAQDILNIPDKDFLGKPCSQIYGETCEMNCLLDEALKTGDSRCSRYVQYNNGKKSERILSLNVAPIRNSSGTVIGGVEIFSDITGDVDRENQMHQKHDSLVRVMTRVMEKKDEYILSHSERVQNLAAKMALEVGISSPEDQRELSTASLLHDIGLLSVPDEVLNSKKNGSEKVSPVIRAHPVDGEWMLSNLDGFDEIKRIVRSHHERFDGEGYPDGISGENIPVASRIISLVEAYDAMCHDEATERRGRDEIFEELKEKSGSQFDPELVDIFLSKVVSEGDG
jgi:putative nucleotidyltransferase with HDIG domain/PAS domain S-box-containing protein